MENKNDIYTIIVVVVAIIIIVALMFLFYYFSIKSEYLTEVEIASVSGTSDNFYESQTTASPTNVMYFKPWDVSPKEIKSGNCWVNSIAEPFREDAFRCMVDNAIYDPCFQTPEDGFVFCQMNPSVPEAFLIELTKPLPTPEVPKNKQSNWAWFVKLKDGTYCSPFTGTRPFFPDGQVAYYGCNSDDKNQQIVLIGDLTEGNIWTATEAILTQQNKNWVIKSSKKVEIDSVWQ
jgi:hypothetical protein